MSFYSINETLIFQINFFRKCSISKLLDPPIKMTKGQGDYIIV